MRIQRVGDYLLGEKLGEGSFAKVRVGLHVLSGEKVAVKIINKEKARKDPYVFKNLRREGRLLQRAHHRHVITILDTLETENNYYLITELVSGGEMIDMVEGSRGLPEHQVRRYIIQVLVALQHLHTHGLVHRDLKVENLLLDDRGNIKIIDFGLSNFMPGHGENQNASKEGLTTQCGSPAYAAPELLAKKVYGPKVDVWSAGIVAYALLTGRLPFTVEPFKISSLYKKMVAGEMNHLPTTLSKNCREFISKILAANPDKRPTVDEAMSHKWLKEASDYSQLVATNSNLCAEEDERVLNSDVIKTLTSSLGFNFSEVITSVQKHRPSRAFAAYELLSRKAERTATKSNVVSLRDVRNEMERNRAKPKNQSGESDSGFENKSSSSETDVANKNLKMKSTKKKQTEISLDIQDVESTNKKETFAKQTPTSLPLRPVNTKPIRYTPGPPTPLHATQKTGFRLPRIDGSLDRATVKPVNPPGHRLISSIDVEHRMSHYDEVVRPSNRVNGCMPRHHFGRNPVRKSNTLDRNYKNSQNNSNNQNNNVKKNLLQTYKKLNFPFTSGNSTLPSLFGSSSNERRTRVNPLTAPKH